MGLKQYDYDSRAELYDLMEHDDGEWARTMNQFLNKVLRRRKARTVLDMTCGTGAQSIGLANCGYRVVASDINPSMLRIARKKARGLGIKFRQGDIRKSRFGRFDAVISIFNAVGHLTPDDFRRAIGNVRGNLDAGGVYVVDVFNVEFMKAGGFRAYEFIDVAKEVDDTKYVRFNDNGLDRKNGVLRVRQRTFVQKRLEKPTLRRDSWEMQMYTVAELEAMLLDGGFQRVRFYGGPDRDFDRRKSLSILAVADTR
jgi:SAM-dependent methyltransferase